MKTENVLLLVGLGLLVYYMSTKNAAPVPPTPPGPMVP